MSPGFIVFIEGKVAKVVNHRGFVELIDGKVSIPTDDAVLGSTIDMANAVAEWARLEEQVRQEHDAKGVTELGLAHAGGVSGIFTAAR